MPRTLFRPGLRRHHNMKIGSAIPDALSVIPAAGYHVVQRAWEKLFVWGVRKARQASIPVLSVGNLVMGGSGKTPFAIFLATMLQDMGMKPALISRGYRGNNRAPYLVVSDGFSGAPLAGPDLAGDEPFLMARRLSTVPVLVGRKRIFPVQAAFTLFGCNVAVLDDGFQHHDLKRDLDIVLLTGREDRMFPAGHLREPISALKRADVVVLTGQNSKVPDAVSPYLGHIPVFPCRTIPLAVETGGEKPRTILPSAYANRDVVLVSGIADPARFFRTAQALGWNILDHRCFPDHHSFTDDELKMLLARFPGVPHVFTEKDWAKLPHWVKILDDVAVLCVGAALEHEDAFRRVVQDRLRLPRS
jgi:tetraacyldisaccharide 4'-kinase